jgi:hypothetical protein
MSSRKLTQASAVRVPVGLDGWKVAVAIGAAVTLSPVIGLVLFVALATLLPVLPLLATLLAGFWLRGQRRPSPNGCAATERFFGAVRSSLQGTST